MKTGSKIMIAAAITILILAGLVLAEKNPPPYGRGPNLLSGRGQPDQLNPRPLGRPIDSPLPLRPVGPNDQMILKNILKQLDLTKEQRQQVKGIIEANKEGLKNATESVRSATIALNKAVSNGEGEADIRAAAAALGSAIANKAVLRATTIASIKRILTPEQLQQVKQLKGRQARPRPKVMTPNPGVGRPGPGPAGVGPRQGWGQGLGPRFGDSVELGPNGPRGQTPFGYGPGQPFAQGMNPVRMFDRIDINGDGLLTRDEFQAANILQQIFKRADADKDGVLTIEELNAFRNGNQGGPRAPRW